MKIISRSINSASGKIPFIFSTLLFLSLFNSFLMANSEAGVLNNKLSADLQIGRAYNNNIQLNSSDTIEDNTDTLNTINLNLAYGYLNNQNSSGKINIYYSYDAYQQIETNYQNLELSLPYKYYINKTRLGITPLISSYRSNGSLIMRNIGASIDVTQKIGFYRLGLTSNYISNIILDDNYSDYAGGSTNTYLKLEKLSYASSLYTKVGYTDYSYSSSLTNDNSYSAYYAKASYIKFYKKITYSITGQVFFKKYAIDPIDDLLRNDTQYLLSLKPSYRFSKNIQLFIKGQYLVNKSNLITDIEDRNYNQITANMGLNIRF